MPGDIKKLGRIPDGADTAQPREGSAGVGATDEGSPDGPYIFSPRYPSRCVNGRAALSGRHLLG